MPDADSSTLPSPTFQQVTPHDTLHIPLTRALWVGVQGDIVVNGASDGNIVTFKNAVGLLPLRVQQVLATGTTATSIVALY